MENVTGESRTLPYNSNEENIAYIQEALERRLNEVGGEYKVFTMMQRNSPSKVTITEDSRRTCAGAA